MTDPSGRSGRDASSRRSSDGRPIVVVGAGAVGSFLATCLAVAGEEVCLVGRAEGPTRRLVVVVGPGRRRMEALLEDPGGLRRLAPRPRALVLAVKQFDLEAILEALASEPPTAVVTVQNGIGAEDAVLRRLPGWPLVAASLTAPLTRVGPGTVHWLRRGGIALAPVHDPAQPIARALARAFARAGLPARLLSHWAAMKWSKLLLNLAGNATSALLGWDPGRIYADPIAFAIERRQLLEALAVIRAARLPLVGLPGADPRLLALALQLPVPLARPLLALGVSRGRGGKTPSLGLAVGGAEVSGNPPRSEVRWLNGAVVEAGQRLGLATPVNEGLWRLVEELAADPATGRRFVGNPEALAAAVNLSSHRR
jgi:2-dehydropantoate 2-reductase